jgi:hypothetical protein
MYLKVFQLSNKIGDCINVINIFFYISLLQYYCAAIDVAQMFGFYLLTYLLYLLTPWIRVDLEKLTISQLVQKFLVFY